MQTKTHFKFHYFLLSSFMVFGGCSTYPPVKSGSESAKNKSPAYDAALSKAFAELEGKSARNVADQSSVADVAKKTLSAQFKELRGSYQIVVFPKVSSITEKSAMESELTGFAGPRTFQFSTQRLLGCRQFLKENTTQFAHRKFYPQDISKELDCAVIRVRQVEPKLGPSELHQDDFTEARIYLDSDYRAYGIEYQLYDRRRHTRVTQMRLDENEPLSSGLTLFPLDLPKLDISLFKKESVLAPEDVYVRNKLSKMNIKLCENAYVTRYRDVLGTQNKVSWCEGDEWPSLVENNKFLAVLKKVHP